MMTKEERVYQIVKFYLIASGQGFLCWGGYIVNTVYTRARSRQIKYKAIMTKEGSAKIVNFITIRAGVLILGCGYMNQYS